MVSDYNRDDYQRVKNEGNAIIRRFQVMRYKFYFV